MRMDTPGKLTNEEQKRLEALQAKRGAEMQRRIEADGFYPNSFFSPTVIQILGSFNFEDDDNGSQ